MPKKAQKGGGAKGGGAKKKEEKLVYLQRRAQAEEEMAKKKQEILTHFLKDKLQKEEKNTKMNLLKLNEGWRSMLRQTQDAELRKDIMELRQTFENEVDGLDSVIKHLVHDLQERERQSSQVRHTHLQRMDQLWVQQDKRLKIVQQQWEAGMQHLTSGLIAERKQKLLHSEQERADLEDTTLTLEEQHKTVTNEIDRLYRESIASNESAYEDRMIVRGLKDKLKEMTLQHQEAVQQCSQETKEHNILLATHQQFNRGIGEDMKEAKKLQDVAVQLREQVKSSKTQNQSVEQDLTAARDEVMRKTRELRDQLTQDRKAARKQLTDLTVKSDKATKKLQAVIAKGEKVLRVGEMCRKKENQVSSILPAEDARQERAGPETEEAALEIPELQPLTRRLNAAVLRRDALKKHKADLSRENQQLRLQLRQHLDGMTVSGDTLDGRHNLLTVRQAPSAAAPPDPTRHHTVIEAAHVVRRSL